MLPKGPGSSDGRRAIGRTLKVTVHYGRNMPPLTGLGPSDPFVKVKLAPQGQEFRFSVQNNAGKHPIWNWDCTMAYEGQPSLEFEVSNSDGILGHAAVGIADVQEGWTGDLPLRNRKGQEVGTLHISVKWEVRVFLCFHYLCGRRALSGRWGRCISPLRGRCAFFCVSTTYVGGAR